MGLVVKALNDQHYYQKTSRVSKATPSKMCLSLPQ